MSSYIHEYPENALASARTICNEGLLALGRPKRVGALEIALKSTLPTAIGVERYDINRTPYARQILEDLNLANRGWTKVVFCAVQRSGKSQLGDFLLASGIHNNVDSLAMYGTQALARDGSNQNFRRLITNNPELKAMVLGGHGNSVFTQKTKAGAFVTFLWPSESNIRQRTSTITISNDADLLEDIEGKGDVIGLLHARTQTKGSRAMNFVESAAYAPITMDHDEAKPLDNIFDAYPAGGVVGLWLEGTRCLWFWKCSGCDERFHAGPENFHVDLTVDPKDAAEKAYIACPHCGQIYTTAKEKYQLNLSGEWLGPGLKQVHELPKNKTRSYRLYGVAAGFVSWEELALDWATAWKVANETGDKSKLQRAYTSSMGLQWVDPDASTDELLKGIEGRAEDLEKRTVPDDVHFLVTTIDQQKRRFVVQVHGFGRDGEMWIVDRYNVTHSPGRTSDDGKPATILPSEYAEDWSALNKVIDRTYTTKSGAVMRSKIVTCDTGGQDQATTNAYAFWRQWRKQAADPGLFRLIKGREAGERIAKSEVTQNKSGVILWLLNVNTLKDEASFALGREEPGPRYVHIPSWLGQWFYDELRAEKKDPKKGNWVKLKEKSNNEAFDLLGYSFAAWTMAGGDQINWDSPPEWAKRAGERVEKAPQAAGFDWASLANSLNN